MSNFYSNQKKMKINFVDIKKCRNFAVSERKALFIGYKIKLVKLTIAVTGYSKGFRSFWYNSNSFIKICDSLRSRCFYFPKSFFQRIIYLANRTQRLTIVIIYYQKICSCFLILIDSIKVFYYRFDKN
jgi:hypothetical protein